MKKIAIFISLFFALFFTFSFNESVNASLDGLPSKINENEVFFYKINENVEYNAYKVTYFYYDDENGYSDYEFKLLGENYQNKELVLTSKSISEFNSYGYVNSNIKENTPCYYFNVELYQRTYTYLGAKIDTLVKTINSPKISVLKDEVLKPILINPSYGTTINDVNVQFVVDSEFDYQILISLDGNNWNKLPGSSFVGNDDTTYYWKAIDSNNQESEIGMFSIKTNATLPTIVINGSLTKWNVNDVIIDFSPSNKGTSFYCINEKCLQFTQEKTVSLTDDGVYEIYGKVINDNQTILTDKKTIKIDKTVPSFSTNDFEFIYYITSNAYKYDYQLKLSEIEDFSGIKKGQIILNKDGVKVYSFDYTGDKLNMDLSSILSENTKYQMTVHLEDNAGNISEFSFDIVTPKNPDKPLPIPALIKVEGKTDVYTNGTVSVEIIPDVNGITSETEDYYCVNDKCEIISSINSHSYSYATDGIYVIYTKRIIDKNSSESAKIKIMIDKSKPTYNYSFDYVINDNPYQYDYSLEISSSDTSGINNIDINIKKNNVVVFSANESEKDYINLDLTSNLKENSTYNVDIKITDNAGNVTAISEVINTPINPIKPVVNAPTISINGEVGVYTNKDVTVVVTKDSNYADSAQDYYCVNQSCSILSSNQSFTYSVDGIYQIFTKRIVNNETVFSDAYTIYIDKTKPSLSGADIEFVETLIDNKTYSYSLNIKKVTDSSGIKEVTIIVNFENSSIFQQSYTSVPLEVDLSSYLNANSKYSVMITCIDKANNSYSYVKIINTSALPIVNPILPKTSIVGVIGKYTNENVTVTITVDSSTKDKSKNYYCVDNSCTLILGDIEVVTFSKDGIYEFYVKSIIDDNELKGNIISIKIDKIAPSVDCITYQESSENDTDSSRGYIIYLNNINDNVKTSDVEVNVLKNTTVYFTKNITNPSNNVAVIENVISQSGTYIIQVKVSDEAGNISTYTESMVIKGVEIFAPMITFNEEYTSEWTNKDISITFTANPNNPVGVKNYYCVKFASCYEFTDEVTVDYEDGTYKRIGTYATYNSSTVYSEEYSLKIDRVAPVMNSVNGDINEWVNPLADPYISVSSDSYSDNESGIFKSYVKEDTLFPEWTEFYFLNLADLVSTGIYHFQACVYDKAGNQSNILEFDIMIDGQSPTLGDNFYEFSTAIVNGQTQYRLTINDLYDIHSGIKELVIDFRDLRGNVVSSFSKKDNVNIPMTLNISSLADGDYYFYLYAKDNVGNSGYSSYVYFTKGGENSTFNSQNVVTYMIDFTNQKRINYMPILIGFFSLILCFIFINKTDLIKKIVK